MGDAYEMVMSLKQDFTVANYWEWFETLSTPLKEALDKLLTGHSKLGCAMKLR